MSRVSAAVTRLDAGAIVDEVDVAGVGRVPIRIVRCPAGWQATFEVRDPLVPDLAVVHRLVADSPRAARREVAEAVLFLLGKPLDSPR
jgi:hypothetical protein